MKDILININGKLVPLAKLPCNKCRWRYSICCPQCEWNKDGRFAVYGGDEEEAKKLNMLASINAEREKHG